VRRTARGVVPIARWLRGEALRGPLVPVLAGVLVLATGAAAGVLLAVGSAAAAPCTAARPEPQPASRTPPATAASSARAALGAPIGVIPVLSR
jgi:hypothetical protein